MTTIITKEGQNAAVYGYHTIQFCLKDNVSAGATDFIGPGQDQESASEDVFWIVPQTCVLIGTYGHLETVPGAGESVAITVRRGALGGAMGDLANTFTFGAADADKNDITNTVSLSVGDRVCIKAIASAGAAAADLSITMRVQYTL